MSVAFVATSAESTRSGTTDSAVSTTVTLTNVEWGLCARRRDEGRDRDADGGEEEGQLSEAEDRDLLARCGLERDTGAVSDRQQ